MIKQWIRGFNALGQVGMNTYSYHLVTQCTILKSAWWCQVCNSGWSMYRKSIAYSELLAGGVKPCAFSIKAT